jgi:hypothetical protein
MDHAIFEMVQLVANVAIIPLVATLWKMNSQITRMETKLEILVDEVERLRK